MTLYENKKKKRRKYIESSELRDLDGIQTRWMI
ncbi:hypothetical protein COLO4_28791 [Corchorus olitorius]|uniref:Uncharacterized protein n=1 Tax=Corchorus olitorius TaxID=93759 RepID=A0A1R3HIA7_9ROSI|nr:hypothetical protein COLO4_28791 [Corchorus olitorius]